MQEVCVGHSVTMSVVTEGTPHRYVWEYSEDGEKNWCNVAGSRFEGRNSSKLTVLDVQESDRGFYRCVVYRQAHNQEPLVSTPTILTVGGYTSGIHCYFHNHSYALCSDLTSHCKPSKKYKNCS